VSTFIGKYTNARMQECTKEFAHSCIPAFLHSCISTFVPLMNGHEASKNPVVPDPFEATRLHQSGDGLCARVSSNRRRNIAIGIRIAVQQPAERRANDREIGQVDASHDWIGRPVEIE